MTLFKYITKFSRPKDNNVNSIVLTVDLIGQDGHIKLDKTNFNRTLSKPISLYFNYLNVYDYFLFKF